MKASFQVLALLTLLSASALTARADEEPPTVKRPFYVFYPAASATHFRVFINKNTRETLSVRLKDANGNPLFLGWVGKHEPGKALSFDLADLPDGTYTVEVKGKQETVSKAFTLSSPKPTPQRFLAFN
jgi:hypothetical protein